MKRTPEIFEKIEQYLTNNLYGEELTAFKKEMAENPELQKEVEMHKDLHEVLRDQNTLAFKKKLARIHKEIREEQTIFPRSWFHAYGKLAASVILILGIGTLLWYSFNNGRNTQELYAAYYTPFPMADATRGQTDDTLKEIMQQYAHKEYARVVKLLEKDGSLERDILYIYLGNSYMNIDEVQKAIAQFEQIEKNSNYYEVAKWYLSLAYLKSNKPQEVLTILKEVIKFNGIYKESALQLQKALTE